MWSGQSRDWWKQSSSEAAENMPPRVASDLDDQLGCIYIPVSCKVLVFTQSYRASVEPSSAITEARIRAGAIGHNLAHIPALATVIQRFGRRTCVEPLAGRLRCATVTQLLRAIEQLERLSWRAIARQWQELQKQKLDEAPTLSR